MKMHALKSVYSVRATDTAPSRVWNPHCPI